MIVYCFIGIINAAVLFFAFEKDIKPFLMEFAGEKPKLMEFGVVGFLCLSGLFTAVTTWPLTLCICFTLIVGKTIIWLWREDAVHE